MTTLAHSQELLAVAIEAALAVDESLRAAFRSTMDVEFKRDPRDVVTVHDKQSERTISELILLRVPDSELLGEEGGSVGSGRVKWFVDPIDGTSNFAIGIAFWCVSIAAAIDGEIVAAVIYDPIARNLFAADLGGAFLNGEPLTSVGAPTEGEATVITGYPNARQLAAVGSDALEDLGVLIGTFKGVRRPGSAALSLAHVAAGWVDAAAGFSVNPWDVAAASLIVRQAGGQYIPFDVGGRASGDAPHLHAGYVAISGTASYPTLIEVAQRVSDRG
jgi:myo-inositol-1(or 4)-monophosphatase